MLVFVTNGVLMPSGQQQRDIKFILQGVVGTTHLTRQRYSSNPPPTLICNNALSFSGVTLICGGAEGVDGRRAEALYP